MATLATDGGAYTVREFCQAHKISPAFYYIMRNEGWGPAEMHAGQRVLISPCLMLIEIENQRRHS
jgi:hypothetical protein